MEQLTLGDRVIGPAQPPYVIAEIGSNHNGDMELCRRLIAAAANAGADAVKFQSWSETSLIADEEYARNTVYTDSKRHFGSLVDMVRAYQLTPEQHHVAHACCREHGVAFCSTPFSPEEVDLLDALDVPFFKVASMDVGYLPFLRYVARKQRPMLISTGMATLSEIERAVTVCREEGNDRIALLHCISIYPPDPTTVNLRNLTMLQQAFGVPVGFSDHTLGVAVPIAAIALGACVIEKHFTLDKDMAGWDHAISADPAELRMIVEKGREVFTSLGTTQRIVSPAEIEKRKKFRRSLVATRSLPCGHRLDQSDLTAKRPGTGIAPEELEYVVGRQLATPIVADQVLRWSDLL
jgi:N-acetylneuraminate synthase